MPSSINPATQQAAVSGHLPWLCDRYRHFHRHPELSTVEHATADRIEQELTAPGLEPQRIGGTGVVAVISNPATDGAGPASDVTDHGPTVLARADIDALPIQEANGLEYASQTPGVMHAGALLGATRIRSENRDSWAGTYIAVLQPGEETAAGARAMVADVLLERVPRPDVALSLHVMASAGGMVTGRPSRPATR